MVEDFPIYDFDPLNLPADLLRAIGLTVAASDRLESVVDDCIATVLGVEPPIGRAITAQLGLPSRISILRAVAHEAALPPDLLTALETGIKQAERASEKRNAIVHRSYFQDRSGAVFSWKITARKRLKSDVLPVSIPLTEADAAFIIRAGDDLHAVVIAIETLLQLHQKR